MSQLMCITLVTVSLLILQKSTSASANQSSPNGDDPKFRRYGLEIEQQPTLHENKDGMIYSNLTARFLTCFTERILSSNSFAELYDTTLPPEEAAETYTRIVSKAERNVLAPNVKRGASILSRAIRDTFDKLTLLQHVQSYGYAAAEFMTAMKVLNPGNVQGLCNSYISYHKQEVKYMPHIPDRRYAFIQMISNSLVHFMASLRIYRADTVELLSQIFIDFLYNATRVSKRLPGKTCPEDKLVNIFADELTKRVMASPKLAEIYDTSLSPEEAGKTYYRVVYNPVANVHACDPNAVARICADAIRDTFANLKPSQHVHAHGYAIARRMKVTNVLSCENVYDLADSYASFVAEAAKNVPQIPDKRYAYIQAVADTHVHFTTTLNLYSGGTFQLAEEFARYLYSLTGIQIPDITVYDPPSCFKEIKHY